MTRDANASAAPLGRRPPCFFVLEDFPKFRRVRVSGGAFQGVRRRGGPPLAEENLGALDENLARTVGAGNTQKTGFFFFWSGESILERVSFRRGGGRAGDRTSAAALSVSRASGARARD